MSPQVQLGDKDREKGECPNWREDREAAARKLYDFSSPSRPLPASTRSFKSPCSSLSNPTSHNRTIAHISRAYPAFALLDNMFTRVFCRSDCSPTFIQRRLSSVGSTGPYASRRACPLVVDTSSIHDSKNAPRRSSSRASESFVEPEHVHHRGAMTTTERNIASGFRVCWIGFGLQECWSCGEAAPHLLYETDR
ncbi:hypothetical protein BDQ12DRAFT_129465 [Crucibulum laeve]|uniref:Uncharacterized protein n=1 Tax=Crucibulum laeve TaxID=68775 RepID=A0A5C3LFV7_9AGAR|nr:hypothetical protein BDQ12DRAFT_129465 [Crucibulum laeve]